MKILVTGGTGVVGTAAVDALLQRGHVVRLLSRHADDDARQWPKGIEPWPGSVADASAVRGSAADSDAVLHMAGVVAEAPPDVTFENTNVQGTHNVLREAERAGVGRFVYVSSLGADRGESEYHKSKRKAEVLVRTYPHGWMILRPGNVYGPGDEVISLLLKMVRSLPVVPVVDGGNQEFQPIFADDLGAAIAEAVERTDLLRQALDLAGPERTSMNDLLDRLTRITNRTVLRVPLPGALAGLAAKAAGLVGVDIPVGDDQLRMLSEGNLIPDPSHNALLATFKVKPTPLDEGLKKLADAQPEQLPSEGVGDFKRKRFRADVRGSVLSAEALMETLRRRFAELTPWTIDTHAEPGTPGYPAEGETLTLGLPLRGNIQVRVVEVTPRGMTFVTLEGHPLAGAVRFAAEPKGDRLRFEITVYDRAANPIDWLLMATGGGALQNATWTQLVSNVVEASGGAAEGGVQTDVESLSREQSENAETWLKELVTNLKRESK
jgi:uncharacterized protein YbjT (DUF2867 family)